MCNILSWQGVESIIGSMQLTCFSIQSPNETDTTPGQYWPTNKCTCGFLSSSGQARRGQRTTESFNQSLDSRGLFVALPGETRTMGSLGNCLVTIAPKQSVPTRPFRICRMTASLSRNNLQSSAMLVETPWLRYLSSPSLSQGGISMVEERQ